MNLNNLPQIKSKKNKRVGRGTGSGKGAHTTGRGQKGQKSRSSVALWFEGGQLPLSKRLPFWKGKDRFKSLSGQVVTVKTSSLSGLKEKTVVDRKLLLDLGLISAKEAANNQIKLLKDGELKVSLTITDIKASASARKQIESVGGKFINSKDN